MSAALDGDGFVYDVALHFGRGRQAHFQAPNGAFDMTVYHDVVGNHFAGDHGGLANSQKVRADVALNRAFDLNVAGCAEVTLDRQVGRNDGR